jgi:hypothetical protein
MKLVQYGLLHNPSKELLKFSISDTSEGEFCGDTACSLELNNKSPMVWLVDDAKKAEFARQNGENWYSSSYDFPVCDFDPSELSVVELVSDVKVVDLKTNLFEDVMTKKAIQEAQELGRVGQCQRVLDLYLKDKKKLSARELKAKYKISSTDLTLRK